MSGPVEACGSYAKNSNAAQDVANFIMPEFIILRFNCLTKEREAGNVGKASLRVALEHVVQAPRQSVVAAIPGAFCSSKSGKVYCKNDLPR